ncbi:XdhC family protein [Novosphingobium sp.]|uniref:XdhC family protein n=1 Tax=Novosphingobium sp. TaxID=1874826 RepID=UPI0038B7850F
MIAPAPIDAVRLLLQGAEQGVAGTLVTLVGIEGSSSRAIGTHMAVLADGRHLGSFSAGCIERAVQAEALDVLAQGRSRTVRYGAGSPYIDVRLPCGGGIDLLFTPAPPPAELARVLAAHDRREMAELQLDGFTCRYPPALRVVALGHGEDLTAFAALARAYGLTVDAFAPASDLPGGFDIAPLPQRDRLPAFATDRWTAIVFLFHDRDWEEFLLPQALALPSFYCGAVGSRRTHSARIDTLRAQGVPAVQLDALRGNIGLIPGTRDCGTLALSILAEVVQDYQASATIAAWAPTIRAIS